MAAFGGHLFYDLFVQGSGGGHGPSAPPGSATVFSIESVKLNIEDIIYQIDKYRKYELYNAKECNKTEVYLKMESQKIDLRDQNIGNYIKEYIISL